MKTILLARVSSKEQEENHSIPAQLRRLTEYAEKKRLTVIHTFQLAESSTKDTRKQFEQIVTLIKKSREPIALIVDTVDRLQRGWNETVTFGKLRAEGKVELHFLRENLIINKNSTNTQLTQWDMGVIFATSYVRQLSDNVRRSKEQSIKDKEWSAKAPFGYKNVTLANGKKFIEVDQNNAPYVVKMFELYASGLHSFQTIANVMDQLGVKNAYGRPILPSRIQSTLKNPFYYGVMRIKGELHDHKYQPLITFELFCKAQKIMTGHDKAPVQYAGKQMLLRGLIKCKQCGCTVTGDIKKEKYVYYSCGNAKKICKKIWVREEKLVAQLLGQFDRMKLSDAMIKEVVFRLKQAFTHEQDFFNSAQQRLRTEFDHIQNRLSKIIDLHLDGTIDQESYRTKVEEYKKRQREITAEMQAHVAGDESCLVTAQTMLALARNARAIFESSNADEKRELLNFVYSNLLLDAETLHLDLAEPFLSMTKMSDQPLWLGRKDSNLRMPGPKPGALPLGHAPNELK
jgi:site-specific DNA recombinase